MVALGLRKFFSSKFNLGLVIALVLLGVFLIASGPAEQPQGEGIALHYFYLPTCHFCKQQEPILHELEAEMPDVKFLYHDASTPEGGALFYEMAAEAGLDTTRLMTPTIILNHGYLVGLHTKEEVKAAIEECKEICAAEGVQETEAQGISTSSTEFDLPFIGRTDLTKFSLPALAIVLGLIDGFNPCAMWVLVYLIALLMDVEDKKKMWLIVGSFVFASGLLYFLFMTAWLNVFLLLGYIRALTIVVGLAALGGGILSLREYLTSKGKLECKASNEESSKKTMTRIQKIVAQPISITIILAIFTLAFIVNSVEFVCSSAIPAVFTQILALKNIAVLERYGYILLYDLFYMLDDIIIFSLAVFAISSSFGEKYARYCKLIGGIILAILGIMLLFAPNLLM